MMAYAKALIQQGDVKQISPKVIEVGEHTVIFQTKKGRQLVTCSCLNNSMYCNSPVFCSHKFAAIVFLANKDFLKKIDKLILEYEKYKELKLKTSNDCFINDLKDIKNKF